MTRTLAIFVCFALTACQTQRPIQPPKVVEVVVTKIVPVPDKLTVPCDQPQAQGKTVAAAVLVANQRKLALDECSKRMKSIRELGQ